MTRLNADQHILPGTWPTFRHDDRLSGHQPLAGNISRPTVRWRARLGGPIFDAWPLTVDGESTLLLLYGGCILCHGIDGALRWKTAPLGVESIVGIDDVDDDGRAEIVANDGKSVLLFSAHDGALLWREYLGPPAAGGFMHTGALLHRFAGFGRGMQLAVGLLSSKEVVLYDFSSGARSPERRHVLWMDDFFHPSLIAADLDGDGAEELIVTKYSAVYAFDPSSGEMKSECRWTSGGTPKRNYGLFEARDLNDRGVLDLVAISPLVSRHVAVIGNDGAGNLALRWDRFIGHIYPHDETELRYVWNSCCDVDGDGRPEIVVGIYNERGDRRWHLEVLDARTGESRVTVPDVYLHGIQDLGGGSPAIVVSAEKDRYPAPLGDLSILRWQDGGFVSEWEGSRFAPLGRFPRREARKSVYRMELPPDEDLWFAEVDGRASFFLREAGGHVAILRKGDRNWEIEHPRGPDEVASLIAVADIDGDGRTEMMLCDWRGRLFAQRADGSRAFEIEVGWRYRTGASQYYRGGPNGVPVVVEKEGDRFVVVPDSGEMIHLLGAGMAGGAGSHARFVGRGRVGPEEGWHSVSIVRHEAEPMILTSRFGSGRAALRLIDLEGGERWSFALQDLPANPPVPNSRAGVHEYLWIDCDGGPIIVASGFRSGSMNSETTYGIHVPGRSILWQRTLIDEKEFEASFAPWNAMSACGDRVNPRVAFLAKDTFCEIDARTGEFTAPPWRLREYNAADMRARGMTMDDFSAYGTPVPIALNAEGDEAWVLLANYGGMGVVNIDHTVRWWRSFPLSTLSGCFGGVADVDGDGVTEIGLSLADGDFVCLRADIGVEKWRLHLGQVAVDVVTCDIDGDGKIEFVLGTRQGELMAVGTTLDGAGLVKWRLPFDFSVGLPVVADVDGDGCSEILVVTGDGYLNCVGNS